MSFLQKAKEKASEVAREAADATSRAAEAVSAKAHDPDTQERMRAGLASAGRTAADVSVKAADASAKAAGSAVAKAQDPTTQAKVKEGLQRAGRSARTMVERIDPGILADVVIKATALQEMANTRLRQKGSIYRIGELQVTASIPPGISFGIVRVEDTPGDAATRSEEPIPARRSSTEILAAAGAAGAAADGAEAEHIVSLDGDVQAEIAGELAATEASLDATVDALDALEAAAGDRA